MIIIIFVLLKQIDSQSLTIVRINVYDGQSTPRQSRVSSLPTGVTRWGDKTSTQLSRPDLDPKSGTLPTAPSCLPRGLARNIQLNGHNGLIFAAKLIHNS